MLKSSTRLLLLLLLASTPGATQDRISPVTETRLRADRFLRGAGDEQNPNPPPGTIVVVSATLSDNGDDDGWADTNETVDLRINVYNRMGFDVTGLVAELSTDDPKIACIADPIVTVGAIADRETRESAEAFSFLVGDVNRTSLAENFSVTFTIAMSADQFVALPDPATITLDLDLNTHGGSGRTTYFESFETGFGSFEEAHIDESLNPPNSDPLDHELGLQNADGYRCQYVDPDWERSIVYGSYSAYHDCYPGVDAFDDYWFHVTDDRAFSGTGSLHWGAFVDEVRGFTSPVSQLEAIRMSDPVNLGHGHVCEVARSTSCSDDSECPIGEACVPVAPVLSFKHQISLLDHRGINAAPNHSSERGVVAGQVADGDGEPLSDWMRLEPYVNVYDTVANRNFFNCTFDPVDDGNTEGDFFDPSDPVRQFGPSSSCYPNRVFADQGETSDAFDPDSIGDASDGPGLEGELGLGTWVEPRFSLSRFTGRRLRLRFLATGQKLGLNFFTWDGYIPDESRRFDDGWFIDDVMITDVLAQPATVSVDESENVKTKADWDLDGIGATCDCAPEDAGAWGSVGEVTELLLSHEGGVDGTTTLSWTPPAATGGTVVHYDTLCAIDAREFPAESVLCIEAGDDSDTASSDSATPEPGAVHYFLVRAGHACGGGPLGQGSSGEPRVGIDCLAKRSR